MHQDFTISTITQNALNDIDKRISLLYKEVNIIRANLSYINYYTNLIKETNTILEPIHYSSLNEGYVRKPCISANPHDDTLSIAAYYYAFDLTAAYNIIAYLAQQNTYGSLTPGYYGSYLWKHTPSDRPNIQVALYFTSRADCRQVTKTVTTKVTEYQCMRGGN